MHRALIVGLADTSLRPEEGRFLKEVCPAGLILFARNVEAPDQLRKLISDAREAIGSPDCLVAIDHEGGRVQRLRSPHWTEFPAAARYGELFATNAKKATRALALATRLCAAELRDLGINTNCAPCLDLPVEGAHDVIGDRAYGRELPLVVDLGRIVAKTYMEAGVLPVIKHMPGHGRAKVDSHKALPIVETEIDELVTTDFAPFRALKDLPAAMTAHVVYTSVDSTMPATTSERVIGSIVRDAIGFDNLLLTDDLSMSALRGDVGERALAARTAGCDLVLHCDGNLYEMKAVADQAGNLSGRSLERFLAACAIVRKDVCPPDIDELRAQVSEFLEELR